MKSELKTISVIDILQIDNLNMNPPYQRGDVWPLHRKQKFLSSILRGIDIPKVYLHDNTATNSLDVVDGKQRLLALRDFRDGRLVTDADSNRKMFVDLGPVMKHYFDTYPLHASVLSECTEQEVRGVFLTLQNGSALVSAEKRNAVDGWVRTEVLRLIEHPMYTQAVKFENRRRQWQNTADKHLYLALNGDYVTCSRAQLARLYSHGSKATKQDMLAVEAVQRVYDALYDALKKGPLPFSGLGEGVLTLLFCTVLFKRMPEGALDDLPSLLSRLLSEQSSALVNAKHPDRDAWYRFNSQGRHATEQNLRERVDFFTARLAMYIEEISEATAVAGNKDEEGADGQMASVANSFGEGRPRCQP